MAKNINNLHFVNFSGLCEGTGRLSVCERGSSNPPLEAQPGGERSHELSIVNQIRNSIRKTRKISNKSSKLCTRVQYRGIKHLEFICNYVFYSNHISLVPTRVRLDFLTVSKWFWNTVMHYIMKIQSMTDCIYDSGPIRL